MARKYTQDEYKSTVENYNSLHAVVLSYSSPPKKSALFWAFVE